MTMRVLGCWALCAALVSADDKPKNAAEAVDAMNKAKTARPRSRAEVPAILEKMIASGRRRSIAARSMT